MKQSKSQKLAAGNVSAKKNSADDSGKKSATKSSQKKNVSEKKTDKKDFLCVGLGASAGGVRALQDFFAVMPPNSGMAFIVVLHLAPNQKSSLAQILQSQTTMPIVQVHETHKVEPNHVYVIPPNYNLEMVDGTVRLAEPEQKKGVRVVIDVFFRTLAEAYERNAVCVVLSGTGSDGTLGLKRIKETNGFAIVQQPEDAEYEQMPRSAIATGIADWVLPVSQMPEKLIRYKESSERLHLTGGDEHKVAKEINAEESLREILTILRVQTGHDFTSYKMPTLIRRIARHLQIRELEDIPTYLNFLRDNPEEVQSLQRNLLINVTNFFRDRESFEALEKEIVPKIMAGKTSRDSVRVWTAACASGEEAYSIGILLHEYAARMPDPPKIQIFATDVDDEAVAEAREGVYTDAIETDVSPERLKRFFLKEGNHYRIRKEMRESILFAPHNVLRDPPFSKLHLVTCRNLLIYLNRDTQERVMEIFHFALNLYGYIFLGSSETAESLPTLYSAVDKKNRIYKRRATHGLFNSPPRLPNSGQWQFRMPETRPTGAQNRAFALGEVHYKLLENLAPPSLLVNQDFEVVYMSESVGRFLRFAGGEPTNNVLKLISTDLLPDLRAALFTAKHDRGVSEFPNLRVTLDGKETFVNLIVRSVNTDDDSHNFLLIIFEEPGRNSFRISADRTNLENLATIAQQGNKDAALETIVERLEAELQRTRTQLRANAEQHEVTIEELKASNEELQAINEELRSASEELETGKEELQSVNEELITVNHELKEKIDEVSRTNSDLQNLISSTDIATIFLDTDLRIKRFTPPVEDLININQNDLGRPLDNFTNRLDYENIDKEAAQVLRTLKPFEREVSDRNGLCFLMRLVPYRSLDDRIEGVVMNFVDITERKQAEKSKFFLAAIVESSGDSMITIDFDRKITSWNKAAENLYGYPAAEAIGKPLTMLTLPEDIKQILANIDKIKHSQKVEIFDSIRLNKNGRVMNLEVVLSPVKDGVGEVIGVSTIARDVTERRKAEEALRQSEERFRAFVSANSDVIYTMNPDWTEMRSLIGKDFISDTSYPTTTWLEKYIHPDDQSRVLKAINKAIKTKSEFELEHRVVRVDGTLGWTHSRAIPLLDEAGKLTGWFGAARDVTERKRAEEALAESHERRQFILNSAKVGEWELDLTTGQARHSFIHDRCFGATEPFDEWSYEIFLTFVHPDDRPEVERKFGEAIKQQKDWDFECRIFWADRSLHWIQAKGYFYRDSGENQPRMLGIVSDITERKQTENTLRESEERFRAMFEQANVGIVQVTVDGQLLMPNQGFCKMLGYSEREVKRLYLRDVTHADDYEKETELTRKLLASKVPAYSLEKRYIRKDGEIVWGNMTASVVFRTEHDPQCIVAIVEDITERKTAEEALRKSEEHLNLILESVKDYAIITYDLEGRITRWNAGAEKTFGFSEKEAVGQKTHFIFTPEDIKKKEPEKELESALKKGRAEDERWHVRKDGSRFYASGVMQPLRDSTTQGFVKVCRDQTQKLNVEKTLREKDMLARMVAAQEGERRRIARDIHDHFGQQLTALRLKLETIQQMCGEEKICSEIEEAQKSVTALDADADFIAWELRPIALDDLGLRVALENFVREWSHHTKIQTEFHTSGLNRVPLDFEIETNLYRIAQEALNNIYKHSRADKVSVLLERRKDLIVLIIEDNGKGFNTNDKKVRSKGIGLSGMSERAKILGGELEIESEKRSGSTVYARVPLVITKKRDKI